MDVHEFWHAVVYHQTEKVKNILENLEQNETVISSLAMAYELLMVKNIPISEEIEYLISSKLVEHRFFTITDNSSPLPVKLSLENVGIRIQIINEQTAYLVNNLHNGKYNSVFSYRVLIICQHLEVLKKYLKTTYYTLPWIEMQFCLLILLTALTKDTEGNNIYKLVLDGRRVVKHLGIFVETMMGLSSKLSDKDINPKLRLPRRDTIIKSVVENNPGFENLYNDYDIVRDIYSLTKITNYIQKSSTSSHAHSAKLNKLMIQRTLQVIGENLKTSVESPNISRHVHQLLTKSAPAGFKIITTSLRDTLSHAHCLLDRLNIEDNKNEMFLVLKSELKLIQSDLYVVLNARKIDAVFAFLNKIQLCDNIEDVKYLLAHFTLKKTDAYHLFDNDLAIRVVERIEEMFGKIQEGTDVESQFEMKLFEKISGLFMLERLKIKKSYEKLYLLFKSLSNIIYSVRYSDDLIYLKETFNVFAKSTNFCKKKPTNFYKIIGALLVCMHNSLKSKESMNTMSAVNDLVQILYVHTLTMRTVEDFKIDLDQDNSPDADAKLQIDSLIKSILLLPIPNQLKSKISDGYEKKKRVAEVKTMLNSMISDLRQDESSSTNTNDMMEWERLVKQLDIKKDTEQYLISYYKSGNIIRCANLLNLINDSYTTLCKCTKGNSIFINNYKQNAIKTFLVSLKLPRSQCENIVEAFIKYQKDKIKICYKDRLEILESVLNQNKIITHFIRNSSLQFAVEALLLDLLEILENMSFLSDNRLIVDNFAPVIIGKALRNYLAHGNLLLDTLPFKPSLSLLCTALKLIHHGDSIFNRENILIGKIDILDECCIAWRNNEILNHVKLQANFLFYAFKNDVDSMVKCIEEGANIFGRSLLGIDVLGYAAIANGLESFEFAIKELFKTECEDNDKNDLLHNALNLASTYGSDRIITYFIDNNLDLVCSFDGSTIVHFAAQYGHIKVLEKLILTHSFNVNVYDDHNLTPLHFASGENHIEIVKLLLLHGCRVSDVCLCSKTALHCAARNGHKIIVEILLNHETLSTDCINAGLSTPLHLSAENGHSDVVSLLLQHGADPFLTDKDDFTPLELCVSRGHVNVVEILFHAMFTEQFKLKRKIEHVDVAKNMLFNICVTVCSNGYISILQFLIKMGVVIDKIQNDNCDPLINIASQRGHGCITNELIAAGSDVNCQNKKGHTPLHFSCNYGHGSIVDALISAGANVDVVDENGLTPLSMACVKGHIEIVKNLVRRGAAINLAGPKMMTPLHAGVQSENVELVKYLLRNNAHVNVKTVRGISPLHLAVRSGLTDVVCMLIEHRALIDVKDVEHFTPLHLACCHGHPAIVRILLEKGANMDITTILGEVYTEPNRVYESLNGEDWCCRGGVMSIAGVTPMHLAALQGHLDIVLLLLEKGALFDVAAEMDLRPFNLACQEGHTEIAKLLMKNGANVYHNAGERHHCITCAVRKNQKKAVITLLKLGAQANERDSRGYSLLHIAAFAGYAEIVHVLLANGASVDAAAANGETPLHMAMKNGKMEIVLALEKAGANPDMSRPTGEPPLDFAVAPNKPDLCMILCDADEETH